MACSVLCSELLRSDQQKWSCSGPRLQLRSDLRWQKLSKSGPLLIAPADLPERWCLRWLPLPGCSWWLLADLRQEQNQTNSGRWKQLQSPRLEDLPVRLCYHWLPQPGCSSLLLLDLRCQLRQMHSDLLTLWNLAPEDLPERWHFHSLRLLGCSSSLRIDWHQRFPPLRL